jgi:hypothetical protein
MFTPQERAHLRSELLEYAACDPRIVGAAITGSAASGCEDNWSDIDLAFSIVDGTALTEVIADWSTRMYDRYEALHHVDVNAGAWIYRVFLLSSTLQVDLAFVHASEFRALAPTFQLVFGFVNEPRHMLPLPTADVIGTGWLYALHARSCLARRKYWQAEYMISGVRDHALVLACIRHGVETAHGRGFDELPAGARAPFEGALVRHLELQELLRAFRAAMETFLTEIRLADTVLAGRLQEPLAHCVRLPREWRDESLQFALSLQPSPPVLNDVQPFTSSLVRVADPGRFDVPLTPH